MNGYLFLEIAADVCIFISTLNRGQLLWNKYAPFFLTLLHSEQPKLNGVLAVLSAIGFRVDHILKELSHPENQEGSLKNCFLLKKWQKAWKRTHSSKLFKCL